MHRFSQSLQKSIEEWELERKKLILEEQEVLKTTKTFFEQSNQCIMTCSLININSKFEKVPQVGNEPM